MVCSIAIDYYTKDRAHLRHLPPRNPTLQRPLQLRKLTNPQPNPLPPPLPLPDDLKLNPSQNLHHRHPQHDNDKTRPIYARCPTPQCMSDPPSLSSAYQTTARARTHQHPAPKPTYPDAALARSSRPCSPAEPAPPPRQSGTSSSPGHGGRSSAPSARKSG